MMSNNCENILKLVCCTCLSRDRKLNQLIRQIDGVNILYMLVAQDTEAYKEGFYKDATSLLICWECSAVLKRIALFRKQTCKLQKQLTKLSLSVTKDKNVTCLSKLSAAYKFTYDKLITYDDCNIEVNTDNFVDCGVSIDDIKCEPDDDIPLSELQCFSEVELDEVTLITQKQKESATEKSNKNRDIKYLYGKEENVDCTEKIYDIKSKSKSKVAKNAIKVLTTNLVKDNRKTTKGSAKLKNGKKKTKKKLKFSNDRSHFALRLLKEKDVVDLREKRKLVEAYANALLKCDSCIESFKTEIDLQGHNSALHTEKPDHRQCHLCRVYVKAESFDDHSKEHYQTYLCQICNSMCYSVNEMDVHSKECHKNVISMTSKVIKGRMKSNLIIKQRLKPRRNPTVIDIQTENGFQCTECDKYFNNKNQRWKHIQRSHKEGYACNTCGKRFAFKSNLNRHEDRHRATPPREECPVCKKMIRVDLLKTHSRIHSERERFTCVECDKVFVSRASYEHHLKYTQAHVRDPVDVLKKHKCTICDKRYKSRAELKDHTNYQHLGKTKHRCPVCGKALATPRCITRHVRRAHDGIKDSPRDKICQQCGKAFRDRKGLREHEFIHTGERPLSCEVCGCTFRQSACLYTHKKRIHKIHAQKRTVELLQDNVK